MTEKSTATYSAKELASLLGQHEPTAQQCAVIEAPLGPSLVVAGAGSGKTETMANRVVWLVANDLVRADEVLGLTFTRKAAGQLNDRISRRLSSLRAALGDGTVSAADDFEQASVSTYNSFASALFRDNALRIGREPESVLLGAAAAWQLARRVVVASTDERLIWIGRKINTLTDAVLEFSHQLGENVADPSAVAAFAAQFDYLADLPYSGGRAKADPYASVKKALEEVGALPTIVSLATQFADEKRRRGLVEFSDQVAFALEVCQRDSAVIEAYRERYRVVLLDEYQDTSVVQTRLLSTLFADHPVMAVGDPHQSIYGWRGASAANLARFGSDFARDSVEAATFSLSISWRNSTAVLEAANAIVEPLRQPSERPLDPKPNVSAGAIDVAFPESIIDEAIAVATWFKARLTDESDAAILFRQRAHMELFAKELDVLEIKNRILGIGGLLSAPEIVDLVSTLRVMHDPSAGSPLIRLLSGARWSIGPRDLKELAALASWLHSHDWAQNAHSVEVRQRLRESVAVDDGASIVDALDFLTEAPLEHRMLAGFSEQGLARMRAAGVQLAFLRSRAGLELPELVRLVAQELLLDIEVVANDGNRLGRANLYAFNDELENFMASDDSATLGSFLGWLERAERDDDLGPRSDLAEKGAVQLLTIHGAKGLEWDFVAIPRLVESELPSASREGTGWVGFAKLPFEFRGDASELPQLRWRSLANQQEFDTNLKSFKVELAERFRREERRLGYVALTRAKEELLLTGSFWASHETSRKPSSFLLELVERGVIDPLPEGSALEENPVDRSSIVEQWPLRPLGALDSSGAMNPRERAVRAAAAMVERADATVADGGSWQRDLDQLLAERAELRAGGALVELPTRIAASKFKDFITEPAKVATALRRPMPEKPFRATRLGTLFHSWVEERYGVAASTDLIDASDLERDGEAELNELDAAELEKLQGIFERSEFAGRQPVDVEIEIHVILDGQLIVCKIDAVFLDDTASDGDRYQVVDWKTGKAHSSTADLELRQLQLALYRLAYSQWKGIDPSLIDAVFYFVAEDRVVRPERIFDEAELIERWRAAVGG